MEDNFAIMKKTEKKSQFSNLNYSRCHFQLRLAESWLVESYHISKLFVIKHKFVV